MIDYTLKFPSKEAAVQFGMANGFTSIDENGEPQSSLASHEHALCIAGEHNGSDWWVLFRDLADIPVPAEAEQFIFWASDFTVDDEEGNPVPVPRPISDDVPNIWWA